MKRLLIAIAVMFLASPAFAGPPMYAGMAPASESQAGSVELATDAEAIAGADTSKALTPAALRAVILDDMADATLSGTPVVLGVKDKAGNVYYFKAYPTKN